MQDKTPKAAWVAGLPSRGDKVDLGRLVDADGGHDEAENGYYEAAADPTFVQQQREQRRFRGAYLRRMRRLGSRDKDDRPRE